MAPLHLIEFSLLERFQRNSVGIMERSLPCGLRVLLDPIPVPWIRFEWIWLKASLETSPAFFSFDTRVVASYRGHQAALFRFERTQNLGF